MSNFAEGLWLVVSVLFTVAYIIVLVQIAVDLIRDPTVSGKKKVLWILGLLFFPVVTAILYIVLRGSKMAERQQAARARLQEHADAYARRMAGPSSTEEIARAKSLHEAGTINDEEFAALKRKAIEGPTHAAPP
ncbi:MAG: hypothetical protein HOV81_13230 [Kofleriaceae bacterium]|nr:hypothetical protein [Kofleriaceae bacterium]